MADVPPNNAAAKRVKFHYIKSSAFRVVHVNGLIGGWNGVGELHIARTRSAQPLVEQELLTETLGPTTIVEGRTGFCTRGRCGHDVESGPRGRTSRLA